KHAGAASELSRTGILLVDVLSRTGSHYDFLELRHHFTSAATGRVLMNRNILRLVLASIAVLFLELTAMAGLPAGEELAVSHCESGSSGGHLVVSLRSEPKTLNPVVSNDISSREVLALTHADLIHIDRATQQTQAALAKSWKVSSDGLKYTLQLRRGL